jgi:hypothetical protein
MAAGASRAGRDHVIDNETMPSQAPTDAAQGRQAIQTSRR